MLGAACFTYILRTSTARQICHHHGFIAPLSNLLHFQNQGEASAPSYKIQEGKQQHAGPNCLTHKISASCLTLAGFPSSQNTPTTMASKF